MPLGTLKFHSDLLWNLYFHSRNRAGAMLCPYRNVKSFPTSYWWKVFIQHLSDLMFCLCYLFSVMEDRQHLATCQESPMRSVLDWNSLLLLKAGHYAVKNAAEPACIWCQSTLGGNNPFKSFFLMYYLRNEARIYQISGEYCTYRIIYPLELSIDDPESSTFIASVLAF